jgi:hypothetical protein
MAKSVNRPGIITLLGILGIISGISKMFAGLLIALESNKTELMETLNLSHNGVIWTGVIIIALGALTTYIAVSVLSGEKWAQVWYGVVAAFGLVYGIWSIFADNDVSAWSGAISAVINFVILQLLFNDRAQAYFEEK